MRDLTTLLTTRVTLILLSVVFSSCGGKKASESNALDNIAESYVKLVLEIGVWDPGYVDAYYGPENWLPDSAKYNASKEFPKEKLREVASDLLEQLTELNSASFGEMEKLRLVSLQKQIISVRAVIDLMSGVKMTFDEESRLLYDAVVPPIDITPYDSILLALDNLIPGKGTLADRIESFNKQYEIPENRLHDVIKTAIDESRKRTHAHIKLPADEQFTVEYVTHQPWGAYNWYKGNHTSLIEINTDLPKRIGSPVGTGAHEGYPGHHVYQVLLEERMVTKRNWQEFSIFPIYSPQGLIAEGSANFGIKVAFPGKEREQFEREILFPMAGIDSSLADIYYKVRALTKGLRFAGIYAGREYLDGHKTLEETIEWIMKYRLSTRKEAEHSIKFYDKYRSYIINYSLGQEMVENWINRNGGTDDNPDRRWELFYELISTPQTPSGIQ